MKIAKLKEALEELKKERDSITGVIVALEHVIEIAKKGESIQASMKMDDEVDFSNSNLVRVPSNVEALANASYVKLAQLSLRLHGKPMNIKELVYEVSKVRGRAVSRNSLEGTLFRHIKSAKE